MQFFCSFSPIADAGTKRNNSKRLRLSKISSAISCTEKSLGNGRAKLAVFR